MASQRERGGDRSQPLEGRRAFGSAHCCAPGVPWLTNVLEADQPGRGVEGGRQEEVERPLEARDTTDQRLLHIDLLNSPLR